MALVPRQANLGYFGPFMRAYGGAAPQARVELYMDTQAYRFGRESAAELYGQVTQLLGLQTPPAGMTA